MTMTPADREKLTSAVRRLETPGLAIRLSNLIGKPIESGIQKLPVSARDKIQVVTEKAMKGALKAAVTSLGDRVAKPPRNRTHKLAATLTGTAGGAFGLAALAVELPLSTTIILRSIADIARAEGEDLNDPEVQLACLEVFALGGESEHDDGADVGYFAVRQGLTGITRQAAKYLGEKGLADDAAPVLLKLIAKLAARFSIPVSEKFIAQAIPVIGALGGGAVNLVFVDHFQEVAHGHFAVRRLEKIYGESAVKEEYRRIRVSGEAYL